MNKSNVSQEQRDKIKLLWSQGYKPSEIKQALGLEDGRKIVGLCHSFEMEKERLEKAQEKVVEQQTNQATLDQVIQSAQGASGKQVTSTQVEDVTTQARTINGAEEMTQINNQPTTNMNPNRVQSVAEMQQNAIKYGFDEARVAVDPAARYGWSGSTNDEYIVYRDGQVVKTMPAISKVELLRVLTPGSYEVELYVGGRRQFRERLVVGNGVGVTSSNDQQTNRNILDMLNERNNGGNGGNYNNTYRDFFNRVNGVQQPVHQQSVNPSEVIKSLGEVLAKEKDIAANKGASEAAALADMMTKMMEISNNSTRAMIEASNNNTRALMDSIKEMIRDGADKKNDGNMVLTTILTQAQKQQEQQEKNHQMLMDRIKVENDQRMKELELKSDIESKRAKEDAERRIVEQNMLFTKLSELDNRRQEIVQKSMEKEKELMDRRHEEVMGSVQAAMEENRAQMEREREYRDQIVDQKLEYEKRLTEQQLSMSDKGMEIEKTKMYTDAIIKGVTGIGNKIESALASTMGPGAPIPNIPSTTVQNGNANGAHVQEQRQPVVEQVMNEQPRPNQGGISSVFEQPWFQEIKNEVLRVIKRRQKVTNPALKPHGSLLASVVIDKVNEDLRRRPLIHYLTSRGLDEVVADAAKVLTDEEKQIMLSDEGNLWFNEFQEVLIVSWNAALQASREQAAEEQVEQPPTQQ